MTNRGTIKRKVFFTELIKFLNEYEIDSSISRIDIMNYFKKSFDNFMSYDVIDKYRNWLTQAGFLQKATYSGHYKLVKKIDENLSSSKCEKLAYPYRFNNK